jgi:hypothetical protein
MSRSIRALVALLVVSLAAAACADATAPRPDSCDYSNGNVCR